MRTECPPWRGIREPVEAVLKCSMLQSIEHSTLLPYNTSTDVEWAPEVNNREAQAKDRRSTLVKRQNTASGCVEKSVLQI